MQIDSMVVSIFLLLGLTMKVYVEDDEEVDGRR